MTKSLADRIERLKARDMTADEIAEQRVSFAYGNTASDDPSTKDEVRASVTATTTAAKRTLAK